MPHSLKIHHEQGFVHLTYSGEVELEERKTAREAVFQACEDQQLSRVLVDMRDSNIRMTEKDVIRFATSFQRAKAIPDYRLACVVSPHNQTENLMAIMINLEGINVKYFMSMEEAVRWLTAVKVYRSTG